MMDDRFHSYFMRLALREAELAAETGDVPAGCVIIRRPDTPVPLAAVPVIGRAHNQTEALKDPTAHAEILAITQAAAEFGDWRLTDTVLYVTKEPCPMCAGAIVLARIPLVVWGLPDPKRGGQNVFSIFTHPGINHHPEVLENVELEACEHIIKDFFRQRRNDNSCR